jgi:hypothetical protein
MHSVLKTSLNFLKKELLKLKKYIEQRSMTFYFIQLSQLNFIV